MSTIISSDVIFARIIIGFREIFSLRLSGVTSPTDLMSNIANWIRDNGQISPGLITVDLRNQSQGWTSRRSIMIA